MCHFFVGTNIDDMKIKVNSIHAIVFVKHSNACTHMRIHQKGTMKLWWPTREPMGTGSNQVWQIVYCVFTRAPLPARSQLIQ